MSFHIISSPNGSIYFLRTTNMLLSTQSNVEESLLDYIHHALDSSFVIDKFNFKCDSAAGMLWSHIKPVIEFHYTPNTKEETIQKIIDEINTLVIPNTKFFEITNFEGDKNQIPADGIYVYKNSTTDVYTISRQPHNYNYFPNFTLEWKQLNVSDSLLDFMFNDRKYIYTKDSKLVKKYQSFISTMVDQDNLNGFSGDDQSFQSIDDIKTSTGYIGQKNEIQSLDIRLPPHAPPPPPSPQSKQTLPAACLPAVASTQ